uniref:Integrase catalytic domain-containing protein n=1 Tax=Fagus sylvatica TaxID=28930 RepID=A0A2N9F6C7_FAGSY
MMRTKGKEDDKDTSEAEPEGHSNTNATPPRPPTPPKPEGKDSQLDSKIDSLEEKIRLIQGLNSFGNTDFSSMSWFPNMTVPPKFKAPEFEKYNGRGDPMIHLQMYCRKMAPYADNEPLLIQTFQDTLTGNAAEWYSQLKKISHWKELADTFLAQYGFNSQIAPDRFDLQRMEKKSNETFREYAQRWREKAARARPPLDEREMIKIFVDTLKNPYFDRMMGLQMQFFVDLIPVGERIEDALKTKKIVDMTALMALAEQAAKKAPTKRKEGDVQMIGRNNGRPRQVLPTFTMQPIQPRPIQGPGSDSGSSPGPGTSDAGEAELYPILIEKSLISPIVPKPYGGPQRRDFNPNSACDFHFGEVGHTVENCGQLRHRVQDLIDHGVLKFEGLPNITTNPLPKHPEGGVNMVEIEEGNEESIAWRRLFYTLEKQKHITPLDAPPGPSTGDACEYHSKSSRARGHSLECCEEFKKKITNLMENGLVGREEIPSERSHQPEDPSDFDWTGDHGADWGYFMEDDTDEWRDVDFTEFFQFPCLIVPPGFVTPEFEIFYEDGDPEVHLQKYGEKMALHLENELLMISVFPESLVFLERYRFNPHSILEYLGLKKDEEPYIIPDPGVGEVIVEIKEEPSVLSLPALTEGEEGEEPIKAPPPNLITTAVAEEEYAGPMVEGLSIHTIARRGGATTPPTPATANRERSQDVDLRTIATACLKITRKTSNDPHVSKIDNKTDCSLDNIDNSDEEIELPKPREVKIGTRCAAEQKEALIALLREFHEIFAWSYQDMPGLDTDIVVHKIPLKPECKPVKQALRRMKPEVILKIKEEVEKHSKGFLKAAQFPKHSFIVSGRGIEIDPAKVQAIRSMPAPKTEKEIRSFLGRINYVARFIAQLTATCEPLFKLLRKDVKIKWTEDCQRAFDKIKEYLLNPPILVPPTPGRPLILYLTVQEASMGCMLGQQDETGKKEQAIYYLSKKFTEPETRYLLVEKTCCALAWASKKLRQYMLYYTTWLAIKGQAIADYLADYPSEQLELMDSEFPDEDVMTVDEDNQGRWKLYFDGAANAVGSGIGAVLVSPKGQQTPIAVKLGFDCTNNMTELTENGKPRDPKLIPYQRYISRLIPKFKYVTFTYTPRAHNHFADALATLASLIKLVEGDDVRPLRIETRDIPAYCVCIEECMNVEAEIDDKPWYYDIKRFIQDREYPSRATENEKKYIRRMAFQFLLERRDFCTNELMTPPSCDVRLTGHEFILVAIDYFTKWVEACSFKNVTQVAVTRFVKNNIICRYGMPEMLITDNASNLNNRMMDQLCQQFKIQHHNSAPYRPKMNGAVEAANKNVKKILSKMTETYKGLARAPALRFVCLPNVSEDIRWSHPLLSGVWDGSSTTSRSGDPFFENPVTNSTGRSLNGPKHAYNKKARPRTFQPGDLVLKKRNMALSDPRGKFAPSYEGPYVVKKAFSGGAIILADMDGEEFRSPINSDSVIKYHV